MVHVILAVVTMAFRRPITSSSTTPESSSFRASYKKNKVDVNERYEKQQKWVRSRKAELESERVTRKTNVLCFAHFQGLQPRKRTSDNGQTCLTDILFLYALGNILERDNDTDSELWNVLLYGRMLEKTEAGLSRY